VVSRSSPQVLPSRRDRRRQETITDIKTAARAQLAEGGPTGISLRAIARQLGLVGRIPPQLQPTALFDLQMAHVSGSLNAPPPP
jgi:hypothetical protein